MHEKTPVYPRGPTFASIQGLNNFFEFMVSDQLVHKYTNLLQYMAFELANFPILTIF